MRQPGWGIRESNLSETTRWPLEDFKQWYSQLLWSSWHDAWRSAIRAGFCCLLSSLGRHFLELLVEGWSWKWWTRAALPSLPPVQWWVVWESKLSKQCQKRPPTFMLAWALPECNVENRTLILAAHPVPDLRGLGPQGPMLRAPGFSGEGPCGGLHPSGPCRPIYPAHHYGLDDNDTFIEVHFRLRFHYALNISCEIFCTRQRSAWKEPYK